jgi:hypothetical protein
MTPWLITKGITGSIEVVPKGNIACFINCPAASEDGNVFVDVIFSDGIPYFCLVPTRPIMENEWLFYDYGKL